MFWPFKKSEKVNTQSKTFMGIDLRSWCYLGTTTCSFTGEGGKTTDSCVIYLFSHKEEQTRRQYKIKTSSNYRNAAYYESQHPYIHKYIIPWALGDSHLTSIIETPSEWLKNEMLKQHQCIWVNNEKKWVKHESEEHEISAYIDQCETVDQCLSSFTEIYER